MLENGFVGSSLRVITLALTQVVNYCDSLPDYVFVLFRMKTEGPDTNSMTTSYIYMNLY